ncbi:MAG TPA: DUF485 domain-containing protein [Candidatus Saccharimonadales bacterium]|nr:DUF485 domain-containing protein [Candidatus Saccharimonadales bacterium]
MPEIASRESHPSVWDRVAASQEFKNLIARKKRFIIPAFVFFLVYYFLLPILVGYAPQLMARKVWGNVNIAYLFALSQFFMAWTIAGLYVRAGNDFDKRSRSIRDEALKPGDAEGDGKQ